MTDTTLLVTGGCGYLGSQLIRDIAAKYPEGSLTLRIVDSLASGNHHALVDLPSTVRYEFMQCDLLDSLSMERMLKGVSTVIHLAGVVTSPVSFQHPRRCEQINHWASVSLAQLAANAGVEHFIYASSAAVYGPGGPFSEQDTCRPLGSYAASKLSAESGIKSVAGSSMRCTSLRLGSLYGYAPTLKFATVANRFAFAAAAGQVVSVFGDGSQKRPYIHIRDASSAFVHFLTDTGEHGDTFNVIGNNISIAEMIGTLKKLRPDLDVRHTEQDILNHISVEVTAAAMAKTGWKPTVEFSTGFDELLTRFDGVNAVRLT